MFRPPAGQGEKTAAAFTPPPIWVQSKHGRALWPHPVVTASGFKSCTSLQRENAKSEPWSYTNISTEDGTVPNQQQFQAFNDQSRYWYKGESSLSTSNYVQSKTQSLDTKWTPILFSSKKNFIPQHTPLAPFAGIDHLLKIDIKKNKSATPFQPMGKQTLVRFSPVSRWPLLKHEVPRPTFHSVPVPTCRPVAGCSRPFMSLCVWKNVMFFGIFLALGMPWGVASVFFWLENAFL